MTRAHLNNAGDEAELLLEIITAAEGHARSFTGLPTLFICRAGIRWRMWCKRLN